MEFRDNFMDFRDEQNRATLISNNQITNQLFEYIY